MRFMFKTDYEDDIRLFPHSGSLISYGTLLALLVIAPFVLGSCIMSQWVFVCIYATVGVGVMILTGFTGQASLGHAAFLAIGAYTAAYLQQFNVPFLVYFLAAGLLTGIIGALVGFPALRLQGIYLVIATISFAFIVEEILARWESVTHGNEGMRVKTIAMLGTQVPRDSPAFYFLCLGVLILNIVMIDPFLTYLKDDLPGMVAGVAAALGAGSARAAHIQDNVAAFASANGLKGAIYGVIIVLFVLFEPLGLYGRWLKIKLFFQLFPLYKRATFKRQKIYVKSERNR